MKRTQMANISERELFIGSCVCVNSRQLKLSDYADIFTRKKFESCAERTFALIKPDCYTHTGKIIDAICASGFKISKLKMSKFSEKSHADALYEQHKGKPFYSDLSAFMASDVSTGMELVSDSAVGKFRDILGPTDAAAAKTEAPNSLRAAFGTDVLRNAVHGSATAADYSRECDTFFSNQFGPTAAFNNNTCCVIKPHIVQEGLAGQIIDMILQEGFEISSM